VVGKDGIPAQTVVHRTVGAFRTGDEGGEEMTEQKPEMIVGGESKEPEESTPYPDACVLGFFIAGSISLMVTGFLLVYSPLYDLAALFFVIGYLSWIFGIPVVE